jgi:hypothetical protein
MIVRRIPALVASVATIGGLVAVGREGTTPPEAVFADVTTPGMPAVPPPGGLTGSWFCAGVPASGEEGIGGEVVVANRSDEPLHARLTVLGEVGDDVVQELDVAAHDRAVVDVDELVTAPFVSAFVEIEGGGGVVEQRAVHPQGVSIGGCANATSDEWYLAEGSTVDGNVTQLVLTNPYEEAAIVDIDIATVDGPRQPVELQGDPVPPRSVKVVDLSTIARDEPVLAARVVATRGQLLVARAQRDVGAGRRGYNVTLASPATRDQWWFAAGEQGAAVDERYALFNPTEDDVEVKPVLLGVRMESPEDFVDVPVITVPAREVVTFSPSDVEGMPDGPHAFVFGIQGPPSIVVERTFTRTIDDVPTTSVLLGAPPGFVDPFIARTWHAALGPTERTPDALNVLNVDNTDAAVTVSVVGPDGAEAVPSLSNMRLRGAALLTIDLTDPAVVDRELIVQSSGRILVERWFRREDGAEGRLASWALPASP